MKSLSHNLFWFIKEKQEKFREHVRDKYIPYVTEVYKFDFVRISIHVIKIISIFMQTEIYTFTHDFIHFNFRDLMPGFAAYQGAVCALLITINFVD